MADLESLARGIVKRVIRGDAKGEFEVVNYGFEVVLEAEEIFGFLEKGLGVVGCVRMPILEWVGSSRRQDFGGCLPRMTPR